MFSETKDGAQEDAALSRYKRTVYKWLAGMEQMVRTYLLHRKGDQIMENLPLSVTIRLIAG